MSKHRRVLWVLAGIVAAFVAVVVAVNIGYHGGILTPCTMEKQWISASPFDAGKVTTTLSYCAADRAEVMAHLTTSTGQTYLLFTGVEPIVTAPAMSVGIVWKSNSLIEVTYPMGMTVMFPKKMEGLRYKFGVVELVYIGKRS